VVNWVNDGLLPAHRTPGGHRRILRGDLVQFAMARGFPLAPELEDGAGSSGAPIQAAARVVHRVLIVDDELDFCELVRMHLGFRGGWETDIALSGFATGMTLFRFKPAVVLMDILMPDMDGFEVLKMMQADPDMRHIPVVACTAWRDPEAELRMRQAGFYAIVQKPVDLDHLASVLDAAVRHT
jgi:CheY-like chemotaxis protein